VLTLVLVIILYIFRDILFPDNTNTSGKVVKNKMTGRGSWSSIGGTLAYKTDKPGPYYKLPIVGTNYIGKKAPANANERAVVGAVKAYQTALNRRLGTNIAADGVFGPVTKSKVVAFQQKVGESADGAIGPKTSKALLFPDLDRIVKAELLKYPALGAITPVIVCGVITQESGWDAGAVGFADERDVGLAQINGEAHPEWTEEQRLVPELSFKFVFDYLKMAVNDNQINTIEDAIASYNLGVGGARRWISQGRPALYYPPGATKGRDVWGYINTIKTACK